MSDLYHLDFRRCIGGVGVFLIVTGLSVCAGLGEEDAALSWSLLKFYFTDTKVLTLWVPAFALAALLRVITHKYHHQLIFPACAYRFHHPSFPSTSVQLGL